MAKLVLWWHPIACIFRFVCASPRSIHKTFHNTAKMHKIFMAKCKKLDITTIFKTKCFIVKLQNKRVTDDVIKTCLSIAFNEKNNNKREKLVISIIHYLPWRNAAAFRSSLELTFRILVWAYKRAENKWMVVVVRGI